MTINTRKEIAQALCDLSELLDYPDQTLKSLVREWLKRYSPASPLAATRITDFQTAIDSLSPATLEEIYTRSFDIAPVCIPYITAYLYGDENYERGNLMHKLTDRYRESGFDPGQELPDHIRVVLKFAPSFSQDELHELTEYCLLKPLSEMHQSLQEAENIYANVVAAALDMLRKL